MFFFLDYHYYCLPKSEPRHILFRPAIHDLVPIQSRKEQRTMDSPACQHDLNTGPLLLLETTYCSLEPVAGSLYLYRPVKQTGRSPSALASLSLRCQVGAYKQ